MILTVKGFSIVNGVEVDVFFWNSHPLESIKTCCHLTLAQRPSDHPLESIKTCCHLTLAQRPSDHPLGPGVKTAGPLGARSGKQPVWALKQA